jgi:hypothetical protein
MVREPDLEAPGDLILPAELKLSGMSLRMFSLTISTPPNSGVAVASQLMG